MTQVSVVGTGNMRQAIAGVVANGGNTIELRHGPPTNLARRLVRPAT
jgi:3-hydroxyacyl-CoA dehydrogenase